jgi:2-oxo-3-hexenedioate decarboxylase
MSEIPSAGAAHRIAERDALVRELEAARADGELVTPPSQRRDGFSLADGFAVGRRLAERRVAAGSRTVGQKIGLTYRPVWERVGVTHPLWAPVYADGITTDGAFDLKPLALPRLEIEVLFRLRAGLDPGADRNAVAAAVDEVALAFEIVDCHYPDWVCTPADIVADHGFHAGLVVGRPMTVTGDEVVALRDLAVVLGCDGEPVAEGSGRDVLDGPAEALVELLASPFAARLEPGDVVSTGALTRGSHPVAPGQHWVARATGPVELGTMEVLFV